MPARCLICIADTPEAVSTSPKKYLIQLILYRLLFLTAIVGLGLILLATFQTEFWVFTICYVAGFGITNALTYMVPVHHGWLWFPNRPGLVSGLIICGFGFGALIFNIMSLAIVNPSNESSDEQGKFSDKVNKRVPYML